MEHQYGQLRDALADRYQLEDVVGRGGMAVVYAARDLRHDRRVALKVLSGEGSAAGSPARFLREIRIAAGLNHPHILPLYDSGDVAGCLFIVMPLVEGESLRDRLRREARLSETEAIRIAREVADALAYAHDAGVIHRDVKPENILLSRGHALLADFGIARVAAQLQDRSLTVTGGVLGTPEYMSPEQLLGEEAVGPGSDVYALGCVLFEMLAGAPPYRGAQLHALLAQQVTGPPSLRAIRADLSRAIERTATRALAANARDRFASAREFAMSLEEGRAPAPRTPDISLVVRPFDVVGDDTELAFFSEGLTEEVIGDLSKIRTLRVISRTSAMRLKGTPLDVRSIGREYGVRYVVTGSVRRAGSHVRVATEIADAVLDTPVWAGRFDGSTDDPFTAQEQVARGIVDALRVSLSPEEQRRLSERPIADPRAYECYRKAMTEIVRFSREGLQRAEYLLEQGLAIVGDNAWLFAGLGAMHWQHVNAGFDVREDRVAEATRWLERALAMEPSLADAHSGLAWIAASRGDFALAFDHLEKGLASDPNHSLSLATSAVTDWTCGRVEHLREMTERLQSVDPWELWGVAMTGCERALAGDREGRDRFFKRAFEISESPLILALHGVVRAQDGEPQSAKAVWSTVRNPPVGDLGASLCVAGAAAVAGRPEAVRPLFCTPSVRSLLERDAQWAWHAAEIHALAGLREDSLELLGLAIRQGFPNVLMLESRDATLASLRADPRFAELVEGARQNAARLEAR